jgi:GTPase SAR1 family protein
LTGKVLILAGVANSGKTSTLKALIKGHLQEVKRNVYLLDGKSVCLRVSSPQEWAHYCNYDGAMDIIRKLLRKCAPRSGSLVIMPFTLQFKPNINRHCIEPPIRELRRMKYVVTLVYLRKTEIRELGEADALMRELDAEIIESRGGKEEAFERQARELWHIIQRIDP